MTQTLVASQTDNKMQYHQLLYIDNSNYDHISNELSEKQIDLTVVSVDEKLYVVEAPAKLGRVLKKCRGYELFTFTNEKIISLIEHFTNSDFIIGSIDFIGKNYFDDVLMDSLDNVFYNRDATKIINFIKENKLKVNKFKVDAVDDAGISFLVVYRSGMIYSNKELNHLSMLFKSFFEE